MSGEFPLFPVPESETSAQSYLRTLTYEGAKRRYAWPFDTKVERQLEYELGIIARMDLAGYFLVVWDIMQAAELLGVLAQGRGSAANSAVCYALGITAVDPIGGGLLFERFLSEDRGEIPDIDIDFAHQDREKVIQYCYDRYGREHAAMAAEVITYRTRSAIRDVGKALGLTLGQVDAVVREYDARESLAGALGARAADDACAAARLGRPSGAISTSARTCSPRAATTRPRPGPAHPAQGRRRAALRLRRQGLRARSRRALRGPVGGEVGALLMALCRRIDGFPRHMGIHSGGMVITRSPLVEVAPVEWASMRDRTIIQWDKDDLAEMGLIKIDLLGLGMLSLLRDAFALHARRYPERAPLSLAAIPPDDRPTYEMLQRADSIGVFQVESRAQQSMLPRLKPHCFYDLVMQVAIIRPGPIQGDMIHPFLRRRNGLEPVTYPHPKLEPILERTLGVPLFQEQGMRMAMEAAGFSRRRGRPAAARDGPQALARADGRDLSAPGGGHGAERHPARGRRQALPHARRLRRLRLPRVARGLVRAAGLRLGVRQVPRAGGVLRRDPQRAADGLLLDRGAGQRRPPPRRGRQADRGQRERVVELRRQGRRAAAGLPPGARHGRGAARPARARAGVRRGRAARGRCENEGGAPREFADLVDFARRTGLEREALENLAAAGAFEPWYPTRREAMWALRGLNEREARGELGRAMEIVDEPLPALRP